jgi:hypothetical protein
MHVIGITDDQDRRRAVGMHVEHRDHRVDQGIDDSQQDDHHGGRNSERAQDERQHRDTGHPGASEAAREANAEPTSTTAKPPISRLCPLSWVANIAASAKWKTLLCRFTFIPTGTTRFTPARSRCRSYVRLRSMAGMVAKLLAVPSATTKGFLMAARVRRKPPPSPLPDDDRVENQQEQRRPVERPQEPGHGWKDTDTQDRHLLRREDKKAEWQAVHDPADDPEHRLVARLHHPERRLRSLVARSAEGKAHEDAEEHDLETAPLGDGDEDVPRDQLLQEGEESSSPYAGMTSRDRRCRLQTQFPRTEGQSVGGVQASGGLGPGTDQGADGCGEQQSGREHRRNMRPTKAPPSPL